MRKGFILIVSILLSFWINAQTSPLDNILDTNDYSGSGFGYSLEGPDAPDVQLVLQGDSLKIELSNPLWSNNYNESFNRLDTSIHNGGGFFEFQGYVVYQMVDNTVNPRLDFFDTSKMKVVAQSDIMDNADTLVNHYFDTITNSCDSAIMIEGGNQGVLHTYYITNDAFTGVAFLDGNTYCYCVLSYAFNGDKIGVDCSGSWEYLTGFKVASGSGVLNQCITFNPVGINEADFVSGFSLFPNPASNNINIDFENQEGFVNLQIVNVHGQQVFAKEYQIIENIQLDVGEFSSGFYFVKISAGSGQKTMKFSKL